MSVDSSLVGSTTHRLADYQPTPYAITKIELELDLEESLTRVHSRLWLEARKGTNYNTTPLILNGVDLELLEVKIDGSLVTDYKKTSSTLELKAPSSKFCLETTCLIHPDKNLALEGLYKSGSILCTQCEAEGFRHITYFLDRPDVMTLWQVTLRADKKRYPLLLANGNLISSKDLTQNRHEAVWNDPWPKPSYLFAVAAGDLFCIQDKHQSSLSQKSFDLKIYCEPHNSHRLDFAMQSLKRAMVWDEIHYGREYDLECFHIVAVDSFNMGAMENKGLNIFNASCLLADFNSTTDDEFKRIEAIIAHEYFHNWTGNRITCRDWFQLTLKEGLTVLRDHQFSGDYHSPGVVRLEQVQALVQRQMVEDASALAHPIQPIAYQDINNFYTLTVYEKGAEVIRMLHTLFGAENYRKSLDLYFEKHDGEAATTEDFIRCFEEALSVNLTAFRRWYTHYRTPQVQVSRISNGSKLTLKITQKSTLSVKGEPEALVIPLKTALFDAVSGKKIEEKLLVLDQWTQNFEFDASQKTLISINRSLSAPVHISTDHSLEEQILLGQFDDDPVSKWLQSRTLLSYLSQQSTNDFSSWIALVKSCLKQDSIDNHTKALLIQSPSQDQWLELVKDYDIEKAACLYKELIKQTAHALSSHFKKIYLELHHQKSPESSPEAAAARHLKASCMEYLIWEDTEAFELLWKQMQEAKGMSDRFSAFRLLAKKENAYRESAIALYKKLHLGDNLTWPKWIAVQAASLAEDTLSRCQAISLNPTVYAKTVPNQVRALLATFTANPTFFHAKDGSGYEWIMNEIYQMDQFNPQTAAKMAKAFAIAPRLKKEQQSVMVNCIKKTLEKPLSVSLKEILNQSIRQII